MHAVSQFRRPVVPYAVCRALTGPLYMCQLWRESRETLYTELLHGKKAVKEITGQTIST